MKECNGYVKREENDLNEILGYLENRIEYPKSIEKIILKTLLERKGINYVGDGYDLNNMFKCIPCEYVESWVETINKLYYEEEKVEYNGIEEAYLMYYLPINTYKIHRLLRDLFLNDLILTDVEILDIGCGPGSASIGIIEFYRVLASSAKEIKFNIYIKLLDAEQSFIDIAESCIEKVKKELPENLTVTLRESKQTKIQSNIKLEYMYDLIVISNLLNGSELDDEFDTECFFKEVITSTRDNGSILIIEPGESRQCERLKDIRNKVLCDFEEINIYSPCCDVWSIKDGYKCNCFSTAKLEWERPYVIIKLIEHGLFKSCNSIAFNYLILRKDGKTKYLKNTTNEEFSQIKDLKDNVGKYINVKGVVRCVNRTLKYLFVSICDGSDSMNESKHANLSISLSNAQIMKQYEYVMERMNVGEMIVARNVLCEKMWKYNEGYLLNIGKDSEVEFLY